MAGKGSQRKLVWDPVTDPDILLRLGFDSSQIKDQGVRERLEQVKSMKGRIELKGQVGEAVGSFAETIGISFSWELARDCYILGLIAGTIHFASTAVECTINHDLRMAKAKENQILKMGTNNRPEPNDWLQLNMKTLRISKANKLPIEDLLDSGERIDSKKDSTIRFIERRNKIAHGDYSAEGFRVDYEFSDLKVIRRHTDVPPAQGLDQLSKCWKFLQSWIGQGPQFINFFAKESHDDVQ